MSIFHQYIQFSTNMKMINYICVKIPPNPSLSGIFSVCVKRILSVNHANFHDPRPNFLKVVSYSIFKSSTTILSASLQSNGWNGGWATFLSYFFVQTAIPFRGFYISFQSLPRQGRRDVSLFGKSWKIY